MRVLIAGCGDVGSSLASRLVTNGHEVWGLRRRVTKLPEDVNPVRVDLGKISSHCDLPQQLDWVYFTAAAPERTEEAYRQTYLEGLQNLVRALEQRGERPRRLFFTSSTSVYGQTSGEWVDENSPTQPQLFTGKIMLEAEAYLRQASIPSTVVRFGGIYGPGRGMLLRQARDLPEVVAKPVHFTNRIHRDDCAGVLLHLMSLSQPDPLYVAVDDYPAPRHEVLTWIAQQLGKPGPRLVEQDGGAFAGKRCANRLLKHSGYRFCFPSYKEGYRDLIDALRVNHDHRYQAKPPRPGQESQT